MMEPGEIAIARLEDLYLCGENHVCNTSRCCPNCGSAVESLSALLNRESADIPNSIYRATLPQDASAAPESSTGHLAARNEQGGGKARAGKCLSCDTPLARPTLIGYCPQCFVRQIAKQNVGAAHE